jgi:probable rRNA maturation factor
MSPGDSTVLFRAVPPQSRFTPQEKRVLKQFVGTLTERVGEGRPFTCLITGDNELRRLNWHFRKRDYATDVLSFPGAPGSVDLGDIAISAERAQAQATTHGHSRLDELRILMLHGILHLTGMDHETDKGQMARAENVLRREFGLPDGLIARASPSSR